MEILNMRRGCLGTMDFTLKVGKMKKAEEFCTYPIQKGDSGTVIYLQSGHRWLEFYPETGEIIMSARRAQYANSIWMIECKIKGTTERDKATPEQVATIINAIKGTAGERVGGNNILAMYCDNSNAAYL